MPNLHTIVVRVLNLRTEFYPALEVSSPALKVERGADKLEPGDSVLWTGLPEAIIKFDKGDGSPFAESMFTVPQSQPVEIKPQADTKVYRYSIYWSADSHVRLDPYIEVTPPPPPSGR